MSDLTNKSNDNQFSSLFNNILEGLNDLTTVMGPEYVDDLKRQLGNEMENDTEFTQQIAGRSTRGSLRASRLSAEG